MRAHLSAPARAVLAGLVTVVGLAVPAGATTAGPADTVSHQTSERAAPAVRLVTRGYHDGLVRMANKRQRLVLSFRGTRGDRVDLLDESWFPYALCARITLTHDGRRVARNDLGHFRLPRTGSYAFRYVPCQDGPRTHSLRLTRVNLVHPSREVRRMPRRRGVLYAALVRVPRTGMLAVADPVGWGFSAIATGGGVRAFNGPVASLVLRPGHCPLAADVFDPSAERQARTVAGQRIALLHRGGGAVVAGAPTQHPTTYDGPAVVPEGPLPQALTFEGQPGAWLRAQDGSESDDASYRSVLVGPDGTPRRPAPIHTLPFSPPTGLWRLPSAGSWTLLFFPRPGLPSSTPGALRASGVTVLPPVRTDAAPTTFAPPGPGRAVIAPAETGGFLRLTRAYPEGSARRLRGCRGGTRVRGGRPARLR